MRALTDGGPTYLQPPSDGFKAAIIGIESTPEAIHRYAETAFKMPMIAPGGHTSAHAARLHSAPFAEVEDEPEDEAVPLISLSCKATSSSKTMLMRQGRGP